MDQEKRAVAVEYSGNIPRIAAVARGILVKKLLDIADNYNITIVEDKDLAEILSLLKTGTEIPEDLFRAVAEVLAHCYRMNKNFKKKMDNMGLE